MKFKFIISKLANQFFFISNLTKWHFSCRSSYNQIWLKQSGPLNKQEKTALNKFRKIIKNYGFTHDKKGNSQYLGRFFYLYPEKESWKKLEKFIKINEFKDLKNIFEILKPRFEKIWKLYPRKIKRVKILKKSLKQKKWQKLFNDLEIVLGNKKRIKKMNIVVIFSPLDCKETAAGGANIGDSHITLELPNLRKNAWQLDYSIGILAHEIGHILFRTSGGEKMIEKIVNQLKFSRKIKNLQLPILTTIKELVIKSFVPKGCLGQIYSNYNLSPMLLANLDKGLKSAQKFKKKKTVSYYQLNAYLVWQIYPLALSYLKNKKGVDKNFVLEIIKIIKSIINKNRPL